MLVVADTSPLNYLAWIDVVDVLPELYGRVLIPPQVHEELLHPRTPPVVHRWASGPPVWLEIQPTSHSIAGLALDPGEVAAIALAQEIGADRLLIDDRDGREAAVRLGVPVAGTLAVLRDAALAEKLNLEDAIRRLNTTTFRASPTLVNQIPREFEEARRSDKWRR